MKRLFVRTSAAILSATVSFCLCWSATIAGGMMVLNAAGPVAGFAFVVWGIAVSGAASLYAGWESFTISK